MNAILACLVLTVVCGAICTRLTPRLMREIAAYLMAASDATDERRACYERKKKQYRQEMRLDEPRENVLRLRRGAD